MPDARSPSSQQELEDILQTCLAVGIRVQMAGGYTARVRDTMQHIALALGAERAETWVSSGSIGLAVNRGGWSRTTMRTTPAIGVNFAELSQLSQLSKAADHLSLAEIQTRLQQIENTGRQYPTGAVLIMLGVSCAAFAALFGASHVGMVFAGVGAFLGASVRHFMMKRRFKPFIYCLFSAFVSALTVLIFSPGTMTVDAAVTASIIYLVPGVPLLNGTADLVTSNYLNGLVRLTRASIILLGATLGLSLALLVWREVPWI